MLEGISCLLGCRLGKFHNYPASQTVKVHPRDALLLDEVRVGQAAEGLVASLQVRTSRGQTQEAQLEQRERAQAPHPVQGVQDRQPLLHQGHRSLQQQVQVRHVAASPYVERIVPTPWL